MALRRGRRLPGERGDALAAVCEEWLELARSGVVRNRSGERYKPSAVRGYELALRRRVLPTLGGEPVAEVRRVDLQDLVDELVASGMAAATVQASVIPVKAIFRRLVARGEVKQNPTVGLELPAVRPSRDRVASPREAVDLLGALADGERAVWATAMYAGLRRGELMALRDRDVDLRAGVVRVRYGFDLVEGEIETKGRNRRKVPIAKALREHLAVHRLRREPDAARFFGRGPSPFEPRELSRSADAAWRDAGLRRITLHECRHTFASLAIAAGVNAKALQTYMGHASIQTTFDLYGHLMPGSEGEAAGLLDAYLERASS